MEREEWRDWLRLDKCRMRNAKCRMAFEAGQIGFAEKFYKIEIKILIIILSDRKGAV